MNLNIAFTQITIIIMTTSNGSKQDNNRIEPKQLRSKPFFIFAFNEKA